MALCPIKQLRRTEKRRESQTCRPSRIDFSFPPNVALPNCSPRPRRGFLPAVVTFTTCIAVIRGFQPGPVPSRRHCQLWKSRTRDIIPYYPLNVQFRTRFFLCLPFSTTSCRYSRTNVDSNDEEETEETSWKVGNVEEDFRNLEQAIALSMADQNLQQQERLEMLDYFAQQRKPLASTVRSNLLAPLLASFLLMSLARVLAGPWESLWRLVGAVLDVHFWLAYVAAPSIFLAVVSSRTRPKSLQEFKSRSSAPSYLPRYLTAHESQLSVFGEERSVDPALDDPIVCLLEQWLSASLGVLAAVPFFLRHWQDQRIVSGLTMMTKVAVFASLHQFPLLNYRVFRPHQQRPINWNAWLLSCMVKALMLPWCIVPDLVRLGLSWGWCQTALAHVALGAVVAGSTYGAPMRLSGSNPHPSIPRAGLLISILAVTGAAQHSRSLQLAVSCLVRAAALQDPTGQVSRGDVWVAAQTRLRPLTILLASLGPCVHLGAYWRLLRVSQCDGLSLADLQDNGIRLQESNPVWDQRKTWRWRLRWREPRRVSDIMKQWRRSIFYWLFLKGSVQEKLRRELDNTHHEVKQGLAHQRGLAVLQRIDRELARERDDGLPPPDRTQWKQAAMDRLARMHEKSYERNDLQDVLGIAVYRSLGIGLGFNFDYMRRLPPGVKPSTRRLQARAAKSAIRRVQEIYDPDRARRELQGISDPIERDRRASELRERDQREVQELAAKLSNLIPLDMALDIPGSSYVEDYSLDDGSNSHSSRLRRLLRRDSSQTIQRLLDLYEYRDISVSKASSATDDDSEFIEAWERQRFGRYGDGEGNSTTVTALA